MYAFPSLVYPFLCLYVRSSTYLATGTSFSSSFYPSKQMKWKYVSCNIISTEILIISSNFHRYYILLSWKPSSRFDFTSSIYLIGNLFFFVLVFLFFIGLH